jgi:hypothetical protein
MPEPSARLALQSSLLHRIDGLEARLVRLRASDRRFSWYRLGVLLLGLTAVAAVDILFGTPAIRWALLASALAFLGVVALNRRVEAGIQRFSIWRELRLSQLARLRLDWEHIPLPAAMVSENRSSLDIDLDLTGSRSLHHLLDTSVSEEGSWELAAWLTAGEPDVNQIRERQATVRELARLPRFRDRLLLSFRLVARGEPASRWRLKGDRLLDWLEIEIPQPRLVRLMWIGILFTALDAVLFLLNIAGYLPAYWPFTLALYAFFYFSNAGALGEFLESLVEMDGELDKFNPLLRYLESFPYGNNAHLAALCAPFRDRADPPSRWLRRVKWVTAGIGLRANPLLGFGLNAVLPWDFTFAVLAGRLRQGAGEKLKLWLETWYRLDALISLANFAALNPEATYPEIDPGPGSNPGSAMNPEMGVSPGAGISPGVEAAFAARDLAHPLIPAERRAGNDFTIASLGEVIVITGSNMAGKSTFLKTVGINLCLAYAGGPVTAASLRSLPFRLHTCMRITDSIADGFSYFYAEVKCLRLLLDRLRADEPLPLLYLIDEIFRGTNNRERLAGSQAYTRTLVGARGTGLIATHDLELAGLAAQSESIRNYHFQDSVEAGQLAFDYLLRPGASTTTNALRIMEMEGLPVDRDP